MKLETTSGRLVTIVALGWLLVGPALGQDANAARRADISAKGVALFKNTTNHCHAFRDLVAYAAGKVSDPVVMLEDLVKVLIGESITKRGTGTHYIGNTPGARGDSGFKKELRDGSPQAEHAMAAIYLGKGILPPPFASAAAAFSEVVGGEPNTADANLYLIGGDIGARLSASNMTEIPGVIDRTMCE